MPNTKITNLTAGNPAQSGDEIPVNRGGTDRKITIGAGIEFEDGKGINDDDGNEQLIFQKTASAVNYLEITNAATGSEPSIAASGSDGNVGINLVPQLAAGGAVNVRIDPGVAYDGYIELQLDDDDGFVGFEFQAPNTGPLSQFQVTSAGARLGVDTGTITFVTDAAADIKFSTADTLRWTIGGTGHFVPGTDATYDIGTSTVGINDLHFGSGGIINFDGGDVTMTHSANLLTIAGASNLFFIAGQTNFQHDDPVEFNIERTDALSAGDTLGRLQFRDGTGATYASVVVGVVDDTPRQGKIEFYTRNDADTLLRWYIDETGDFIPGADATYDIGTSTVGINDLHLGSAGVINFDGGDITATHSADKLAFAGGDFTFSDRVAVNHTSFVAGAAFTPRVQVHGVAGDGAVGLFDWENGGNSTHLKFYKSRSGTRGSHTVVQNGDQVGVLSFEGSDGDQFVQATTEIEARVDGVPANDSVPLEINFKTGGVENLTIRAAGTIEFKNNLVPGSDATYDIGTSSVGINDLHLGAAGVINFDGGDVTLTHSANAVTVAGGDIVLGGGDITSTNAASTINLNPNTDSTFTGIVIDNDSAGGDAAAELLIRSGVESILFRVPSSTGQLIETSNSMDFNSVTGHIKFKTIDADNIEFYTDDTARWIINSTAGHLIPGTDATYDIGTSDTGINDLHLGSGGIINFDGGDVTVTHSANTLTITGGVTVLDDLSSIGGCVFNMADNNLDQVLAWDDSAGQVIPMPLATITTEAAPAAGDFVLIYGAEGDLRKVNWSGLPGAGGGISNVVEDLTPQLGGDLDSNSFNILMTAGEYVQFTEGTAPSGTANAARLFSQDNGSGKTQLCVIFGSGAVQVIATEP